MLLCKPCAQQTQCELRTANEIASVPHQACALVMSTTVVTFRFAARLSNILNSSSKDLSLPEFLSSIDLQFISELPRFIWDFK